MLNSGSVNPYSQAGLTGQQLPGEDLSISQLQSERRALYYQIRTLYNHVSTAIGYYDKRIKNFCLNLRHATELLIKPGRQICLSVAQIWPQILEIKERIALAKEIKQLYYKQYLAMVWFPQTSLPLKLQNLWYLVLNRLNDEIKYKKELRSLRKDRINDVNSLDRQTKIVFAEEDHPFNKLIKDIKSVGPEQYQELYDLLNHNQQIRISLREKKYQEILNRNGYVTYEALIKALFTDEAYNNTFCLPEKYKDYYDGLPECSKLQKLVRDKPLLIAELDRLLRLQRNMNEHVHPRFVEQDPKYTSKDLTAIEVSTINEEIKKHIETRTRIIDINILNQYEQTSRENLLALEEEKLKLLKPIKEVENIAGQIMKKVQKKIKKINGVDISI